MKTYIVTYEYRDETKYAKLIDAISEKEAMRKLENKITGSIAVDAEEVEE